MPTTDRAARELATRPKTIYFTKLPDYLANELKLGILSPNEYLVLSYLYQRADKNTGVVITNSHVLSVEVRLPKTKMAHILHSLKKKGKTDNSQRKKGSRICYSLKLCGYLTLAPKTAKSASQPYQRYDEYLKSDHWKQIRKATLREAGYKCAVCNGTKKLQVHHKSYDRLGCEADDDLVVLCGECHLLLHTERQVEK